MGNGAIDLTESAGGDGWVAPITVGAAQLNQYYLICLDNFSSTTTPFIFDLALTGVTLNCSLLLPIELGTLNGKSEGQVNVIEWTTLSEWMNQQFIIERSDDGVHFEDIGIVQGAEYSQGLLNYSFIDESPISLLYFYRLRQVDTNGQWSHTHIISIKRNDVFMISPNPANEYINISSLANSLSSYTVSFYNIEGRKVLSTKLQSQNSNSKTSIRTVAMPVGLYLVMVESVDGGLVYKTKILIQH